MVEYVAFLLSALFGGIWVAAAVCGPWEEGFGCCATGCGGKVGPREDEVPWTAAACQARGVPVECQLRGAGFGWAQSHLALEITAGFGAG